MRWGAVMAALAMVVAALSGCTRTVYEPVERVRTEYRDNVKDVRVVDSVDRICYVYVKGDTVFVWRDRVRWRDRVVHDSIYIHEVDTVPVPYPVERVLTRWERTKMELGGVAMGVCGCGAVWCIVAWMRRRRMSWIKN